MGTPSLSRDELEVLLEIRDPSDWTEASANWDGTVWDQGDEAGKWTTGAGWIDATCDVRGFLLERGRQTVWDSILSASVEIELDNSDGKYSVYGSESWPRIRPGFGCQVWGTWEGVRYPLFNGYVSDYREGQTPRDFSVTIKANDGFRLMADPINIDYNPGWPAEQCGERIAGLLDRIGYNLPRSIAPGNSTMTNYLTTRTVLDEIQLTANSDGGVFFIDNDGTAVYLGRDRVFGRARNPGQAVPAFTDSCSGYGLPYAAVEPIVADREFGNVIVVSNVSQGQDSPQAAQAYDDQSILDNGRYLWSPEQLVLCNAPFVQSLADFQLSRRSQAFYRVNSFECYPAHDDKLWPALLSMRVGDSLVIERTPPESNTIIAAMICDGMRIEATPSLWKFTVRCSPGDSVTLANFWDFANWDQATWV